MYSDVHNQKEKKKWATLIYVGKEVYITKLKKKKSRCGI